jgi:hypothetical protein
MDQSDSAGGRSRVTQIEHASQASQNSQRADTGTSHAPKLPAKQSASMMVNRTSPPESQLSRLRSRPLCIICGRPEEAEAIADELKVRNNRVVGSEVEGIHDDHIFYVGSFSLGEKKLDYYITSSLEHGMQSFAIHASILFHVLRPRYAIHVGVCTVHDDPNGTKK